VRAASNERNGGAAPHSAAIRKPKSGEGDHVRKRNLSHFLTKPRGKLENTNTKMTFSMPRETAASLRDAAVARGTDVQGVIELAVNEWLARRTEISEASR
jgi:hypothetical protein